MDARDEVGITRGWGHVANARLANFLHMWYGGGWFFFQHNKERKFAMPDFEGSEYLAGTDPRAEVLVCPLPFLGFYQPVQGGEASKEISEEE